MVVLVWNPQDFLIQEEIPPALFKAQKFVLGPHILIYLHKAVIFQHHWMPHQNHLQEKPF
jgi:hypothetical protein